MARPAWMVVAICVVAALVFLVVPWDSRQGTGEDFPHRGGAPPYASSSPDEPSPEEGDLPRIVPFLDCMPSARDGQGSAELAPVDPPRIASVQGFEITFTTGKDGIVPGGFIIFQVSPWWGWTPPQNFDPGRPGYTAVEASFEDPALAVHTLRLNRILVHSPERGFRPGETVAFRYGPARVDRFAEAEELFQIFVDADGDGHYACIQDTPALRILPADPALLAVDGPSRALPGEEVEIGVSPLDPLGNWAAFSGGDFTLKVLLDGKELDALTRSAAAGARRLVFQYTLPKEGIFFFDVEGPPALAGRSNALFCQGGEPSLELYFGDIHGHTRLSDGTGTPEDYYRFAREVSGLDIAAVTDHADYGTIPVKGEVWERIKKAANDADEPGRFVTFVGFEWTSWIYGHRNVYYRDGDGPICRSIDPESDTPQELWEFIEPFEAMTIAHHVGGGPIHTDWSIPPGPREWLVEISSVHGSSEVYGGENCIYSPVKGAFVRDALDRGYKLGIIGSGDTHDGHPGRRSAGAVVTGLVGVFAPELTREAVWDAFKRRQVYGTSGPKIILFFQVGHSPMGSEIKWPKEKGPLPIALKTMGCDEIAAVEIIRNGDVVFRTGGDGCQAQALLEDPDPPEGVNWYYARVIQTDGNMAWSSPVWAAVE